MKLPLIIVGAGGHAAVVADALLAAGEQVLGFTDPDTTKHGSTICGLPVLGDDRILSAHTPATLKLVNGIGSIGGGHALTLRRTLEQRLRSEGWHFATVRHPSAIVSPFATVADGVQLLATCVVQPGANVSKGCIINTAAVIEHNTMVGAWTHVAPRALLCGDVRVGAHNHIGAGAVVRQGLRLGESTTVGAGAVVVSDFAGNGLLVGVPARLMEWKR